MAQQTTLRIAQFHGLWQRDAKAGGDIRYAAECVNAQTRQGFLRPMAQLEKLPGELPGPIRALFGLHRRYYAAGPEKDVLIAACGGQLYWRLPDGDGWTRLALPPTLLTGEYLSDAWSGVSYEINPEGSQAPVDVLLLSNAKDGMILIRGDDLTVSCVPTPRRFGVIARHAERIWGTAVEGESDLLCYSAPYDPLNWEQNDEFPEDGAGEVLQPTWDGDSFTALVSFASQLIAFQKRRVWRIMGVHPGEYSFTEQFGGGARWKETVAVDQNRMLMLGTDGLQVYDGESVTPFGQGVPVFDRMNPSALERAVGCMHQNAYYCALALDGAKENNAVLVFDTLENTWLLREQTDVGAFLSTDGGLFVTSLSAPGSLWRWPGDCFESGRSAPMRWVSPWQELERKHTHKSGFEIYLAVESEAPVELTLGVETERRIVKKRVRFDTNRPRRIRFLNRGRRFRLLMESCTPAPWRIFGGVEIRMDEEAEP